MPPCRVIQIEAATLLTCAFY